MSEVTLVSRSNQIELNRDAEEAVRIIRQLQHSGFVAYLAGGCVRYSLLGREPKDYDIATDATPNAVRKVFGKANTLAYGASFGVIGVLPERAAKSGRASQATEVATFRSDGDYSDGRRPDSVHFGDPEQDALRRDFTINGLFFDPVNEQVIDFVGGQEDLRRGLLRTIGHPDDRFGEDRLRMLRAIRFAATLGFRIDPKTFQAITCHADAMSVVSEERVGAEMRRVMVSPFVIDGLKRLIETGLSTRVFPELEEIEFAELERRISASKSSDFRHPLAAILSLASDSDQVLRSLTRRWRLANEEARSLSTSLRSYDHLLRFHQLRWSELQPVLIDRDIEFILGLASSIAESTVSSNGMQYRENVNSVREALLWPPDRLDPSPLIGGNDLQDLGYPPGPKYACVLKQIRSEQLDGLLQSRQHAIERVGELYRDSINH